MHIRMSRYIEITKPNDILPHYQDTPIADLLAYHNLGTKHRSYTQAQLLVGMCMDHRKQLRIPNNFAFILRAGGANLRYSGFKISYAIAIGGIRHIALIAHTQCGMVDLDSQKKLFVKELIEHIGWNKAEAERHFEQNAPLFQTGNETDFILGETQRLRSEYQGITIAPLLYRVEDNLLYLIRE